MDSEHRSRPCIILGSGFSRAISDAMPTMLELGEQVLEQLQKPGSTLAPFGGDLEQWMSYLAVDQPWLNPAENYENRALFARVSEAVQNSVQAAEQRTLASTPIPDWLVRLVWGWCDARAHVLSFNYDTLVERAVMHQQRVETFGDLYAMSLEWRLAAGDGARFGAERATKEVVSLYKLHGSTSWSFSGIDAPANSRVLLTGDLLNWLPEPTSHEEPTNRELAMFDDVVPLIIPPTLTKGPYYQNFALRGQWRRAAEALRQADSLTVIGYSFPAADLVARQWVSTSFSGSTMQVVDRALERPTSIRGLLPNARPGEDFAGEASIESYVDATCGDLVRWRIWDEHDDNGARASVSVNGQERLHFELENRPWGTSHDGAMRWVHDRLEAAQPLIANSHHGSMDGSHDDRWAVLTPGVHVELP